MLASPWFKPCCFTLKELRTMTRILSSGTAMTIATAAGDAGQVDMAAGFLGGLMDLIRLPHATQRAASGDFISDFFTGDFKGCAGDRDGLSLANGFGGDRPWADLNLAATAISGDIISGVTFGFRTGLARTGQRTLWPFRRYLSWHSVYQH
jgi:hypothetical protein